MLSKSKHLLRFGGTVAELVCAFLVAGQNTWALEISFRSFSGSAAIGPPADEYAAKLMSISKIVLGNAEQEKFSKYVPTPPIPGELKNIVAAAGAGGPLAGGAGFDAAYVSGSDLNSTWGFIYNSGVPFGPNFDEFIGFIYGKSIDDGKESWDQDLK